MTFTVARFCNERVQFDIATAVKIIFFHEHCRLDPEIGMNKGEKVSDDESEEETFHCSFFSAIQTQSDL